VATAVLVFLLVIVFVFSHGGDLVLSAEC
jgi:hypothetical protein